MVRIFLEAFWRLSIMRKSVSLIVTNIYLHAETLNNLGYSNFLYVEAKWTNEPLKNPTPKKFPWLGSSKQRLMEKWSFLLNFVPKLSFY
jgi:hypothetical protein